MIDSLPLSGVDLVKAKRQLYCSNTMVAEARDF